MTRMDSDAWVAKAQKRKAYRDHHRDKFFAEVGLRKHADVQDISGAPQQTATRAADLLALTARGGLVDAVQARTVGLALAALDGLGAGDMGAVAENRTDLSANSMKRLRKEWFWSPAFFD